MRIELGRKIECHRRGRGLRMRELENELNLRQNVVVEEAKKMRKSLASALIRYLDTIIGS